MVIRNFGELAKPPVIASLLLTPAKYALRNLNALWKLRAAPQNNSAP
jgi:hypothetical protein